MTENDKFIKQFAEKNSSANIAENFLKDIDTMLMIELKAQGFSKDFVFGFVLG